jgi:thiol-disulfide isomerase/thioredoxin
MTTKSVHSRRALLTATVLSLLLLSCRDGATAAGTAGKPAPADLDFRLKTVDGRTIGPKDYKGQVVVVDFWATWCVPCHVQTRILEPIHRDYKGKGVQFLAANVGEDAPTVRSFLKSKPVPYPVLLDPEDTVSSKLGVVALPTLMIIDKTGKVTFFHTGVADGATVRKVLKQAGV